MPKSKHIASRQREFITRFVREYKTFEEWAIEFNVSLSTITRWRIDFTPQIDQEKAIADNELKEKFENIRDEAFNVLSEDLHNADPKIRVQAWKYILDHAGYNGTKRIELNQSTDNPFSQDEIQSIKEKILSIE